MCIPEIESRRNSRTPKERVPGHIAWNNLKLPASLLPGMFVSNADSWAPPQTYGHSRWGPAVCALLNSSGPSDTCQCLKASDTNNKWHFPSTNQVTTAP